MGINHAHAVLTKMGVYFTYYDMTHADMINLWPSIAAFAADIDARYQAAKAMKRRSVVPAGYWLPMVQKAEERGLEGVTLEALATAAAQKTLEAAE